MCKLTSKSAKFIELSQTNCYTVNLETSLRVWGPGAVAHFARSAIQLWIRAVEERTEVEQKRPTASKQCRNSRNTRLGEENDRVGRPRRNINKVAKE